MSQAAQRVGMLLLVLCIALQAVAQVTQRVAAGLHYHLPVADNVVIDVAVPLRGHDNDNDHDHEAQHERQHAHGHTHQHLAEHEHALADTSVVYVADGNDSLAPSPPAPPPRLHDLDSVLVRPPHGASPLERERWPAESGPLIRSVVITPLERPPRA